MARRSPKGTRRRSRMTRCALRRKSGSDANVPEPFLKVEDVHTYYGPIHVLKGVNYDLYEGEIVCLLGGNASGKTVLGLVKPTQGQVVFDGERIDRLDTSEIIQRGIAVVPEARRIFPRMTVEENLELGRVRPPSRQERHA